MSYLTCSGTINLSGSNPVCDTGWVVAPDPILDLSPVISLVEMLDILFSFDPELFGIVLFGCATLFTTGWGAGVVMRNLSRR